MKIERQELYCHDCDKYVHFDLDMDMDGNHVLECPNCGHEHCRKVDKGKITDIRWDSRNRDRYRNVPVYYVSTGTLTTTTVSMFSAASSAPSTTYFLADSWLQTGTTT